MFNPKYFGRLSRQPVDNCPIKHTICWFKLCPYAKVTGEYELVNWEVKPIVKCGFPFIGRIKAEPDKVTE